MPIRSRMSLNTGQIKPKHPDYLPLNLEKLLNLTLFTFYHLQILTKYTKLGQNACDHKISVEFDYGSNLTRTV